MRRLEHPRGLETDDWKAEGMEADCPHRLICQFLYFGIKGGAVCFATWIGAVCDGQRPPQASLSTKAKARRQGWEKRTNDEQAATSPFGHIEALRAGGMAARVILLLSRWPP